MIIIGYPGIAKDHRFIDLESSYFRNDPNCPTPYVKFAEKISEDGINVLVFSHEEVVNKLKAFHKIGPMHFDVWKDKITIRLEGEE